MYLDVGFSGRGPVLASGSQRFGTAAALDEPITPPVEVKYTKLLINGQFVDSASGEIETLEIAV